MAEPLTIVIVTDHGRVTGGLAKVAIDSAVGLAGAGHRVLFFCADVPDPRLAGAGVEVVSTGQGSFTEASTRLAGMVRGTWNVAAARALGEVLTGLPPDGRTLVHVHGWAKALSPSIARPLALSGLPAVYTMHDYFLVDPAGGFYNFPSGHTCTLKPLSARCWATNCDQRSYGRKLWRAGRHVMLERLAGLPKLFADYVLISRFQRPIVVPLLPAGARVHLVDNPVDAAPCGPKGDPASGSFVFVGRISPEKGPLLFAEAARRLGVVPVFVGDGPAAQGLRDQYPEAEVLGWQAPEAARAKLRAARALVFPSLWYEGQPLAVLEAQAMGTPVIVSDGCAGRESVEDGVTGLWFRSGDADALGAAMTALRDDARVLAMSHAAHAAYWADPLTLRRHVEGIEGVYRTALGGRSGRTPHRAGVRSSHLTRAASRPQTAPSIR